MLEAIELNFCDQNVIKGVTNTAVSDSCMSNHRVIYVYAYDLPM